VTATPAIHTTAAAEHRSDVLEVRTARGTVVCERCTLARTPWTRLRGLLGRRDLPPGDGLLLRRSNAIHMWFMRFAIDAVFLDRDDVVVRIVPSLAPWRMAAARRARSVLELAAGECERRGVVVGDQLALSPARGR
jgi:uncharacterized membrane protein (UPF0127 family)